MMLLTSPSVSAQEFKDYRFEAGDPSIQQWLLPDQPPYPANNEPTSVRVALGKKLFFDPRLSSDGNMSCASCHNPMFGWSDGLTTGRGHQSQQLDRATPTVINTAYNPLQMWDGRLGTLEEQALGPLASDAEMNADLDKVLAWLKNNKGYQVDFAKAYPREPISLISLAKAIASYERTIVSNRSAFDAWVAGDADAMTPQQVNGFKLFVDPDKGNCEVCHNAPNFTDNGFHNVGLASFGVDSPDLGRYKQRPIKLMKGAFKTPTLRDVTQTAPYFHDGSAGSLDDVIEHYVQGGVMKTNLSPNMKKIRLTDQEKSDLIAFIQALSSPHQMAALPKLPLQ